MRAGCGRCTSLPTFPDPILISTLAALVEEATSSFAELTLLALIQGLTEFLPVSSSGHLVLTQQALDTTSTPMLVEVALHVGTLLAVVLVYRRSLLKIARDALSGHPRELLLIAVGTLPIVLVGLFAKDAIEELFDSPRAAAFGLLGTAAVLVVGERGRNRAESSEPLELGIGQALLLGCAQAVAILPGVSRSGSTIAAGLTMGLAPDRAARFSFLLSIPAICGAAILQLKDYGEDTAGTPDVGVLIWAVLFAGFVGWGALRMLLAFLDKGAFLWFALYCAALGTGYLVFA